MTLYFSEATPGTRRFLEYARVQGHEPLPVGMKPGDGATTLVYAAGMPAHTYLLVFQRDGKQKIPRRVIRHIIGEKDVLVAYKRGRESVANEMQPGFMTPFVSEEFGDALTVCMDRRSFDGNNLLSFPAGADGSGFALPANTVKELLIGLYGKEKVHEADFLGVVARGVAC